jgi:hypothetical protein
MMEARAATLDFVVFLSRRRCWGGGASVSFGASIVSASA